MSQTEDRPFSARPVKLGCGLFEGETVLVWAGGV